MKSEQELLVLLMSRTHRRLHQIIDLSDLTAMDAAMLEDPDVVMDETGEEIASALSRVANLVREASDILGPVHQMLMQKAVAHRSATEATDA